MMRRLLLLVTFLCFIAPAAFGQTGTITGQVTDAENGETIPGVNVQLADTQKGAATDPDGTYRITGVQPGTYTLRATFVGFQTVETEVTVEAGETVTQNIEMTPRAVGLDELVVTGYGTVQTAGEITGSISNVGADDIQDVPVQNTEALLQGRAAGVTVAATSGNPGSGFEVEIRGQGSINAGNRPLYIVDGVQMSFNQNSELTDRSPLNAIQPSDIESIEVLKDAAAAAIYGAQAANGVVLITTKSGREGPTQVSLNFEGGVRFQSNRFDLMNRDEWIDIQVDAFGESTFRQGILPAFGYDPSTPFNEVRDFSWQEWLFEPDPHLKAGFSASGGDENTTYFLSGNWSTTGGALRDGTVDYDQYSIRSNVGQQFTEDLNVKLNMTLSNQRSNGVCQDGFFINCPFYQAIGEEPPISYPYLDNGEYNPDTEQSATFNPALVLNEETREIFTTQFVGNLSPTYDITPWLTAKGSFGLDWQRLKENDYGTPTSAPSAGGELSRRFNSVTNMTVNGTLNGDYTFADVHNLSGLLGSEYRREYEEDDETGFLGFGNNLFQVPAAANEVDFFQGFNTEYRILSYFGRANYNYDNRYIVTATARYDGTSRFGTDKRWGFFPSGSVGWRISEEDFFNVGFVDDLKVRASYGVTGNSDIGNFAARGLYQTEGSYEGRVGIRPDQLENTQLTWEENREVNVGVDWSLWRSRLTGSVNLYRSISDNLLLDSPLPTSSGFPEITKNVGQVRNQGIEIDLRTVNFQTESFEWSTRFNMSITQNTVQELAAGADELESGDATPVAVGHSIQAWKVPRWAGVNPADGRPMWYDRNGNLTYNPDDADDRFFDGGEEDVVGGAGTRLTYQGLSLDVFFDFSFGGYGYPATQSSWTDPFGEGILGFLTNRWREPGDIAPYPRATPFGSFDTTQDPDFPISTLWLYKTNYIRLKSARLSYSLPSQLAEQVSLRGVRIYVSGINLVHWSSYLGIDPEVAGTFEESSYPAEQQINVGLQLDL